MIPKTIINLNEVKLNNGGNGCIISLSSTVQASKHVKRKRNQGFGEQNADGVKILNQNAVVEDSDIIDMGAMEK